MQVFFIWSLIICHFCKIILNLLNLKNSLIHLVMKRKLRVGGKQSCQATSNEILILLAISKIMILWGEIFCTRLNKSELNKLKRRNKIYFKKKLIILKPLKADGQYIGSEKTKKKKNALNKLVELNSFIST